MKKILSGLLIAIAGGAVALGLYTWLVDKSPVVPEAHVVHEADIPVYKTALTSPAAMNLPDFEAAADLSVNAVVHIKTTFQRKSMVYDDFFDLFNRFGHPSPQQRSYVYEAMGSGVIISPDGFIVTNNHVVQDASEITVTLNDRREFNASLVGSDPSSDIALVKIDVSDLPFLQFGNSDDVRIGEWVLAVGNPFNLTSTVTAGIVSAKARNINILGSQGAIDSFIQTDAAVNSGNSGGALVNTRGELIGINAAIASNTGYYQGYSFAIPANIARKVVDDLKTYGEIQRAYLGIYFREINDQLAKEQGLDVPQGIYIDDVVTGGSAEKGGLRKGDIILQLNKMPVNKQSELIEFVGQHSPGDNIEVTFRRDGTIRSMPLKLTGNQSVSASVKDNRAIIHGATFEPLSREMLQKYGLTYGFQVTRLESGKFSKAGIQVGFVLLSVDREPVKTIAELERALTSRKGGVLLEGVYPNGLKAYYGMGL